MNTVIAWCAAILGALGAGAAGAQDARAPEVRALFIGNSLTAANDLPGMIEAIAAAAGLSNHVRCRVVAKPNFGLEEHWADGEALRVLRGGSWTHVILQQGPSSLPESRVMLRSFTKRFADAARAAGARTVLFGVWPSRDRLAFQKDVTESYRLAAQDVGGDVVPVGEAWRLAWERDPTLPLYGPDQFHPSAAGSYVAALMLFERLTGRIAPPLGPEDARRRLHLNAAALKVLHDAAALAK